MSDYISEIQIGEGGEVYDIRDLLALLKTELLDSVFPVGSIHLSTTLSTKAQVEAKFGGTWEAWGQGRVPVGVGTSDKTFDANESGGASKAPVPEHSHNATFTGATVPNHFHVVGTALRVRTPALTSKYEDFVHTPSYASALRGTINRNNSASYYYLRRAAGSSGSGGGDASNVRDTTGISAVTIPAGANCTVSGNTDAAGGHVPSGTVNVVSTGSSANTTNLQPYITCYMWKRVA